MTINVIVMIAKTINDSIKVQKANKKAGQAVSQGYEDFVRAVDNQNSPGIVWSEICKTKTKKSKKTDSQVEYQLESINVNESEFIEKLPVIQAATDLQVLMAHNWDGSQYGMTRNVNPENGDITFTGIPEFPLGRIVIPANGPDAAMNAFEAYIDLLPDVEISEGVFKTALEIYQETGKVLIPEINGSQEVNKDFTIHV